MIVKNYEKKEDNTAVIVVECDAAEFEKAIDAAYKKSRKDINVPGFRKGKAPRKVIEGMYGKEVFYQDAMDELAPGAFDKGIEENQVQYVGRPAISNIDITEENTVEYSFTVTLYPEVTLGQYKGVEVTREEVNVTDEDVAAELETIRKRNARKVSVEREAQMGDKAVIDFDGYLDGEAFEGGKAEAYTLELGSNSFVPGFEDQVVGMQIGEEKEINVTFPEDYVENLAGKAVVFKVKLNSLSVDELPELDDDFAQDVSEFDTLAEYTADVKEKLIKRRNDEQDANVRSQAIAKAVENMSVEIPAVMIEDKAEDMLREYAANFGMDARTMDFAKLCEYMGIDENTLENSIKPSAEAQVKNDLLLNAVIKAENIEVSDEDKDAYIEKVAADMSVTADQLKSYFGEAFIIAERKKELAANLIVDSAVEAKAE